MTMKFPETTRCGSDAHDSAVARLDSARANRAALSRMAEAARDTPDEARANRELDVAAVDESARARWLEWVESGV